MLLLILYNLTAPVDAPVIEFPQDVQMINLQWGVAMDLGITPNLANWWEATNFKPATMNLRRAYQQYKDAPQAWEADRFLVTKDIASEMKQANRAYMRYLECVITYDRETLRDAMRETNQLYAIWEQVHNMKAYQGCNRRDALMQLKVLLGDDAFYTGTLPPCVPIWRFQWLSR